MTQAMATSGAIARLLATPALAVLLAACATPTQHAERLAASAGFERRLVAGDPFDHVVFVKPAAGPVHGFRVYVEGDGTPWLTRHRVAADPTPRRPLMLKLMRLDPGPAIFLGRPCYFGAMAHCEPADWTGARYSATVVESMAAALSGVRGELEWPGEITLAGHSGGGVLAVLLAPRVADVSTVVTLAANLDVTRWTALHGYSPLAGSLNPATAGPLPERIRQIHLVGGRDRSVPPAVTRAGIHPSSNATLVRFPEHGHHCCWHDVWRSVLDRL